VGTVGFPAVLTQTLLEMLDEWGVNTHLVLAQSGLTRAAIRRSGAYIERDAHLRVVRQALALCVDRGLGLHFGRRISLRHYGVIGYAMLSSASIRQVMELFTRYHRMTGPLLGISIRTAGHSVVVRRDDLFELGALHQFAVEEFLSSWITVFDSLLEETFHPTEIRVNYPPPRYADLYGTLLKCPVTFDADVVELRFDVDYLDRPLSFADPATAELCKEHCDQLLAQLDGQGGVVDAVRRAMTAAPGQFPSLNIVAQRLHTSVRTLRRKLAQQRTSFRAIDREIRHALAVEYLRGTELPIKQIAYFVGFEDPANFTRAFRSWVGCNPRTSRRNKESAISSTRARREQRKPAADRLPHRAGLDP